MEYETINKEIPSNLAIAQYLFTINLVHLRYLPHRSLPYEF